MKKFSFLGENGFFIAVRNSPFFIETLLEA
ncbi:hypothetical protein HMPREF9447_02018 [Bacteroides oleiciplenus YIT 12058]|uniref:Uncharacterized protein n=1 Tax=Bacteroides oleiciplenus YIT 12058 TaxID=742727 RepID=K9EN48_9BACE|nr:hypothetical protein HMPREF9447_02018 [Bacteroides oleiciplenus YIT 12058]